MDKQQLIRILAQIENEMEDAYNCHDYDGYWDARAAFNELAGKYADLLD